jgi:hypothetical protein
MTRYGQFCPIAKAAEILGDPWAILIVREMLLGGDRFSSLQRGLPHITHRADHAPERAGGKWCDRQTHRYRAAWARLSPDAGGPRIGPADRGLCDMGHALGA